MYIILTKQNCPKCDQLKEKLVGRSDIIYHDSKSIDGMSLLAYHMLFDEKTPFPLLITEDDKIIFSSIGIKKIILGDGEIHE